MEGELKKRLKKGRSMASPIMCTVALNDAGFRNDKIDVSFFFYFKTFPTNVI